MRSSRPERSGGFRRSALGEFAWDDLPRPYPWTLLGGMASAQEPGGGNPASARRAR